MVDGSVFATFIVVFREALEASLIVGIILTVLARLKASRYFSHIWASTALAVLASMVIGLWISGLADRAQDRMKEILEGGISLVASGVLTYMFFWMEKQARHIKPEIEQKVEGALSRNDYLAMVSLPFVAVFREGAETVLFLKAVAIQSGGSVSFWGAVWGFALAVGIVSLIFVGGKKVPLKPLFRFTGALILLMAAGLLGYGIHELEEASLVPQFIYPVWNINPILNEKTGLGAFLKALFGYNGNPSLTEVVSYWGYLAVTITLAMKKEKAAA